MATIEYVEALIAFLFIFVLCHWIWNKNSPIVNWPIVGMLPGLLSNVSHVHDYLTHVLKQSNQTTELKGPWFSNLNIVLTSDPENLRYILSTNFASFPKGPAFREIFEVLGNGVMAAESESWKMQRKLIHSLFKQSSFQKLVEKNAEQKLEKGLFTILDHVSELGLEVDMQDLFQRFTFDLTCMLLFGCDPSSLALDLPDILFAKALDEIEEVLLLRHLQPASLWKLQKWLNIGAEKKASRAVEIFDNFIYHHISLKREQKKRRIQKEGAEEESFDLVSSFMIEEEKDQLGESKLSDMFLRDSVMNLMAAGKDTASVALTWFLWLIATNPSVETNIQKEMKANFQGKEGKINQKIFNFQELNNLVYLHAALCETLRLYPPVPFNHRAAANPDVLPSGHRVGRHTEIVVSMYAMGRMEELWGKDCLDFKPERWISGKGDIIHVPSSKFNVFSAGPRTCVGKDLAFIQMKMVGAAIIWNYHFQIVEGHQVIPDNSIILHMKHGLKVRVTKKSV